jgi:hypothetical protein
MLETAVEEPSENTTPRNKETPLKASELDPGMYGYATTKAKATIASRTTL